MRTLSWCSLSLGIALFVQVAPAQNGCFPPSVTQGVSSAGRDQLPEYVIDVSQPDFVNRFTAKTRNSNPILLIDEQQVLQPDVTNLLKQRRVKLVLKRCSNSSQTLSLLDGKISHLNVFSALPNDAEGISHVYGVDEQLASVGVPAMRKAADKFESLGVNFSQRTSGRSVADELRFKLSDGSAGTVLIVAHNDGTMLRFADDSFIPIVEVNRALGSRRQPGILLSCTTISQKDGAGVASITALEWNEIASACQLALERYQENVGTMSFSDLLIAIQDGLDQPARDRRALAVVAVSSLTGSGVLVAAVIYSNSGGSKEGS